MAEKKDNKTTVGTAGTEAPGAVPANEMKPTTREQFMTDWGADNGDIDLNDEEAVYGRMRQNWEDGKARKQREDRFNEIMAQNNYAPEVMDAIMDGVGPEAKTANLVKLLAGDHREEFRAAIEGDEEALAWLAEARGKEITDEANAKLEEKARQGKLQEQVNKEDALLDEALSEAGKNPEDYKDFFDAIYSEGGLLSRASSFELTKEDFALLIKVADYDKNIAKADEEGYRRGKNEKVDIYADLDRQGSGKPTNIGDGGHSRQTEQRSNPTLDALDRMKRSW